MKKDIDFYKHYKNQEFHLMDCRRDVLDNTLYRNVGVLFGKICDKIIKDLFVDEYELDVTTTYGLFVNNSEDGRILGACKSDLFYVYTLYINPVTFEPMDGNDKRIFSKVYNIAVHECAHLFTDYFLDHMNHDEDFVYVMHMIEDAFWDKDQLIKQVWS